MKRPHVLEQALRLAFSQLSCMQPSYTYIRDRLLSCSRYLARVLVDAAMLYTSADHVHATCKCSAINVMRE